MISIQKLRGLIRDDRGLSTVEYVILLVLIQATTSGHGGCLSTIHATYPNDALQRLETLALMSDVNLPLFALRAQIASGIDLIVQTARHRDGRRGITQVSRVIGVETSTGYQLEDLYACEQNALPAATDSQCNTPAFSLAQRAALQTIGASELKLQRAQRHVEP